MVSERYVKQIGLVPVDCLEIAFKGKGATYMAYFDGLEHNVLEVYHFADRRDYDMGRPRKLSIDLIKKLTKLVPEGGK